jgi:transcriptional regulator with XRE-family HTH domain
MTKKRQFDDLLEYGTALEQLRGRRGLSREDLAGRSGVSYSYLSEVERGLKRPSTDVLVKIATALNMLPSELLRNIEEISAKGRGLLRRRRIYQAPMHEQPGAPSEPAPAAPMLLESMGFASGIAATDESGTRPLVQELIRIASQLPAEDLDVLLRLARRLQPREDTRPSG